MQEEKFSEIGRIEAIEKLFDGTGYRPWDCSGAEAASKGDLAVTASRLLLEGIDFDLVYFPLKHLGYKSVISVIGELYASMAKPASISVVLGLSGRHGGSSKGAPGEETFTGPCPVPERPVHFRVGDRIHFKPHGKEKDAGQKHGPDMHFRQSWRSIHGYAGAGKGEKEILRHKG